MVENRESHPIAQTDDHPLKIRATESGSHAESGTTPAGSIPGDSIITQVTTRASDQTIQRPKSVRSSSTSSVSRFTWKRKFRNLLCCLAPSQSDRYFRADVQGRIVFPPVPKRPANARGSNGDYVMPPLEARDQGKQTLVLDLDETLVHSSFKPVPNPDFIIPVDIDGAVIDVYVLKRPWMDHFMSAVAQKFEVVVFTASLSKYADPLLDLMDPDNNIRHRLFREACCPYEGNYVKDLEALGRDMKSTIIVDNSPHSYVFQPENAIPIGTFIDDLEDQELLDMIPLLLETAKVEDVRQYLPLQTGIGSAVNAGAH